MLLCTALFLAVSGGQAPSGAAILAKCQKAYDAANTLEQTVRAKLSGSGLGTTPTTAHIWFQRPKQLRVTGTSMIGKPYDLVSNGRLIWVNNGANWSQMTDLSLGIASVMGISANAGSGVPSILIHAPWNFLQTTSGAKITVGNDTLKGQGVYRLQVPAAVPMTLWIDKKSMFLKKTVASVMGRSITVEYDDPKVNLPISTPRFQKPR